VSSLFFFPLKITCSDASIDLVAEALGVSRTEAADCICGHCETAAVALSGPFFFFPKSDTMMSENNSCVTQLTEEVIKLLDTASTAAPRSKESDALLQAMQGMELRLTSSSLSDQVDYLFAALKRGVQRDPNTKRSEIESLMCMWRPCLGAAACVLQAAADECSSGDCMDWFLRCTAGVADAPRVMKAAATQCEITASIGCMPLYLVIKTFFLCSQLKRPCSDQLHI
jgi:hypothetical protein